MGMGMGTRLYPLPGGDGDGTRDVKNIHTRRYSQIKSAMGRKHILKMDTHYPRVRVLLIPAC